MATRFSNTLTNKGYAKTHPSPGIINISDAPGQNGYLTDMAYYPSATDYVSKPLIAKVLQVPVGLTMMPNASVYIAAYKNLIETMMQGWTGLNRTLAVTVSETQIGNAGEVFQTPTRVSRSRSQIQSTVVEKDRRPVIRFLEDMTRYLIMDPDTGHPLLTGVTDQFTDQLADIYGATVLFFEPDKTWRYAENAFLVTNFFPINDIGENVASKVLQAEGETRTYNLAWAGWQKVGYAVDKVAQGFIDAVRVTGIDPSYQKPFVTGVDSNVAAVSQTGYHEQIAQLRRSMVTP